MISIEYFNQNNEISKNELIYFDIFFILSHIDYYPIIQKFNTFNQEIPLKIACIELSANSSSNHLELFYELFQFHASKIIFFASQVALLKPLIDAIDLNNEKYNLLLCANSNHYVTELKNAISAKNKTLFNIGTIGFQAHLNSFSTSSQLNFFDQYRLGNIKEDIALLKPAISYSNFFILDCSVFKQCELPERISHHTSGLDCENVNYIAQMIGQQANIRSIAITGLNSFEHFYKTSGDTIAQFLWYYLKNINTQTQEQPIKHTTYIVENRLNSAELLFLKEEFSSNWYFKYTGKLLSEFEKFRLIPCSYQDYLRSSEGELNPRLTEISNQLDAFGN